jgi:hypothetical protein
VRSFDEIAVGYQNGDGVRGVGCFKFQFCPARTQDPEIVGSRHVTRFGPSSGSRAQRQFHFLPLRLKTMGSGASNFNFANAFSRGCCSRMEHRLNTEFQRQNPSDPCFFRVSSVAHLKFQRDTRMRTGTNWPNRRTLTVLNCGRHDSICPYHRITA